MAFAYAFASRRVIQRFQELADQTVTLAVDKARRALITDLRWDADHWAELAGIEIHWNLFDACAPDWWEEKP